MTPRGVGRVFDAPPQGLGSGRMPLSHCGRCGELAATTIRLSELAGLLLGLPGADGVARAARRAGRRFVTHRLTHLDALGWRPSGPPPS